MERAEVMQVVRDKAVEMLEVDADAVQEDKSFMADLQTIGAFVDVIMTKVPA